MTDTGFKCPPLEEVSPLGAAFYTALGRLAVEWNEAERHLRHLLAGYIGGRSDKEQILLSSIMTAELGSIGLKHALEAFAEEALPPNECAAVKHATAYYEILRVYRNYYIHSITGIAAGATGVGVAAVSTFDAKGKLVFRSDLIELADIEAVAKHCSTLKWYLQYLILPLHWDRHEYLRPAGLGRPPLPDRPPLPSALQKPGTRLGWQPQ